MNTEKEKTALLLVNNNDGIIHFARRLREIGFDILASGETAQILWGQRIAFKETFSLIGERTFLNRRINLLPHEVFFGLIEGPEIEKELNPKGIPRIDLVYADLLRKQEERVDSKKGIDNRLIAIHFAIQGKRIPVCDPEDCGKIIEWLEKGKPHEINVLESFLLKAAKVVGEKLWASCLPNLSEIASRFRGEIKLQS